jgi:cytochrome P450
MARATMNPVTLWMRWAVLSGVPRAVLAVQARRGEPLARLLVGPQRGGDPYVLVEQIRAKGRLVRTPLVWVSADHELCRSMLRDSRFKVTNTENMNLPAPLPWLIRRTDPHLPHPAEPPSMLQVDPPAHTRYRHPVAHSFTPRAVDRLRTRIIEVTNDLLDKIEASSHADLITDYAAPLPAEIIAEILAIPVERRSGLRSRGENGAPLLDIGVSWRTFRRGIATLRDSGREIGERIDQLRTHPGDDIFSHIIHNGNLSDHELATTAALLAGAGFETTVNLIGNAIVLLLQHPDQLSMLRDDPDLWPNAVEEVLRLAAPVQMTSRTTLCDIAIGGQQLRSHETVALLLGGANRDPDVFPHPDRFDITRANAKEHLSFSSGVHACLGASLARMEAAIALQALFERFPDLQLTGAPAPRGLATLHGFRRIPACTAPQRSDDGTLADAKRVGKPGDPDHRQVSCGKNSITTR